MIKDCKLIKYPLNEWLRKRTCCKRYIYEFEIPALFAFGLFLRTFYFIVVFDGNDATQSNQVLQVSAAVSHFTVICYCSMCSFDVLICHCRMSVTAGVVLITLDNGKVDVYHI